MGSPLVRRRRIGAAVRELRGRAGWNSARLAKAAGLSQSEMSRLETGARKPDLGKLIDSLNALGVPEDSETYRSLVRVAHDANRRGWWEDPEYAAMGERQRMYADLESGATWIGLYHNSLVPGLLQTPDYVRSREEAFAAEGAEIEPVQGQARLRRQAEVLRDGGPQIEVLLEELVVRRLAVEPAVMVGQLEHMIALPQRLPQVSIRVLPVECSFARHGQVPRTPLALHRFADPGDGTALLMEIVNDDLLFDDPDEVARYVHLFDRMRDVALSKADSAAFIAQAAARLRAAAS